MNETYEKVKEKINIFKQATITEELKLYPPKIQKIFLAIDPHLEASAISKNAINIALYLAKNHEAEIYIACIAPTEEELRVSEKLVNETVKLMEKENISVIGGCNIGIPSKHILELSEEFNPNLIIMPIPFGERSEKFHTETLGATVDLVIRKSLHPTLLVRKPKFKPDQITKKILLLIRKGENVKAAEFALAICEKDTKLKILSITERETIEKVEGIVQEITTSDMEKGIVEHSHKKVIQPIVNGIISEAKKRMIEVERTHIVGDLIKTILEKTKDKHTMLVLETELKEQNIIESKIENLVRLSKIPILIVKT